MPANFSLKRTQDAQRFARWDALPEAQFTQIGTTRDAARTLQSAMAGEIVLKGDPGYDAARQIFNPLFNQYPGAIIYCKTEADVALALQFGQIVPQGFCLRSGGHSTAGYSTGNGVLIDLSALDQIAVDAAAMQATVGVGCTFGQLYQALEHQGLHVPAGECPDVRVGGFVQGGGYGFTSVSYGLNCDNALAFRVMLADGSIVQADSAQNADLYWALRGGTGGNFGAVLSVTYRLRKLTDVTGFALAWALDSASGVDQAVAAMLALQSGILTGTAGWPMNLQVSLCFQNHLDPSRPPPPVGTPLKPYFMVRGMWLGDPAMLPALLAPLIALPGCIDQWQATDTFRVMNDKLLNYPQGMPVLDQMPFEDKACRYIARALTQAEWTALFALFAQAPNNMAYGYGEFYGGAINQVAPLDTAFVHRDVAINMVMDVYWLLNKDRAACETFLQDWLRCLEPLSNGHVYQNYPNAADLDYTHRFWGAAYPVLQAVKAKYDPANAFAFPMQVWAPAGVGGRAGGTPPPLPAGLPAGVGAALAQPVTVLVPPRGGARS
ncbi:MAG: FAD-binding oxidoreductase [Rhodobacter sp.]|nr:FAD-binding oxidoreductase [Rhodobacter sp.]